MVDAANSYAAEEHDGRALVVLCDHLTDAGNLGAISRSCEAVGASGPDHPQQAQRTRRGFHVQKPAGAITHVPVAQVSNIVQSIHRLQEEGFWVCAATEHTDDLVWNANLKGKIAIVLGNERRRGPPGARALRHVRQAAAGRRRGQPERGTSRHGGHVRVAAPELQGSLA